MARERAAWWKTLVRWTPPPVYLRARNFYHGFTYARDVLRDPITSADAAAAIKTRLAQRTTAFLDTVERAIFAYSASPYRRLLAAAGYDLAQIRALVAREGIEDALRRLAHDGVYVSIEEFKGIHEARRGDQSFRFHWDDFQNPLALPGVVHSSGGTRSRGIPTSLPVASRRLSAQQICLALAAYGVEDVPMIVWFPEAAGVGTSWVLAFATMRRPPLYWITQVPGYGRSPDMYPFYLGLKAAARRFGIHVPSLRCVPVGQESQILSWVSTEARRGGCVVATNVSPALRLALAAKRENVSLANVTFLTGSEPLTPAKFAGIQAVGAKVFSRFSFTEFGRVGVGCPVAKSPDEMHICEDTVAVIQHRRPADRFGSEVDALLFTSLQPDARRILLNMETGDYGKIFTRPCGCFLEALGWTTHLEEVRSFEKLTTEGSTFLGSQLVTLIEETLPSRFGGEPNDYQLLEHEDDNGLTRLTILVHPRLGPIDEPGIVACVERTLSATDLTITHVYRAAGTLQVRRVAPMMTQAGKLMPLHHLDRH